MATIKDVVVAGMAAVSVITGQPDSAVLAMAEQRHESNSQASSQVTSDPPSAADPSYSDVSEK